jgi:hypothetical protein
MTNPLVNSANSVLPKPIINKKEFPAQALTIWHIGLGVGLLGGLAVLFGASFLIAFQYLAGEHQTGVWLYLAVLPLWIIGAHCFDKVEEIERARRIEYCKQHGLTETECDELKTPDAL